MTMKRLLVIMCLCACVAASLIAQGYEERLLRRAERGKVGVNPEEVVSFEKTFPYQDALAELNTLCKKFSKKPMVDTSKPDSTMTVGIEIKTLPWREALGLILRMNARWYREEQDYILIFTLTQDAKTITAAQGVEPKTTEKKEEKKPDSVAVPAKAPEEKPVIVKRDTAESLANIREVIVSAIFLSIDRAKLKESGISFSIFRGKGVNLGVEFGGARAVSSTLFGVNVSPRSDKLSVDIDAAIKFFENEDYGEVISRPKVTVRPGVEGRVNVGVQFSIKEKTLAGDVTEKFYDSGTILTVTPYINTFNGLDLITLKIYVEKSDVTPGAVSTLKKTSNAATTLTLLNGEESYVGGLYSMETSSSRQGIPLLKDLPWWFFGLRYLFGYDFDQTLTKELLVFLKAEILPTPLERSQAPLPENATQQQIQKNRDEMQKKSQQIKESEQ
jgi:type IV pilus assembly protein PilQ